MNQERKSPVDPILEPESPEVLERLEKFERRLQAARPQMPQLDLAALQRIADDISAETIVELAPDRKLPGRKRRISGRVLAIASSWVCGAVVGALVMLVFMSRAMPQPDQSGDIVHIEQETPASSTDDSIAGISAEERDPVRHDDTPAAVEPLRRDAGNAMLTKAREPLAQPGLNYLSDGSPLRAGAYLRRNGERLMRPTQGAIEWQGEHTDRWTNSTPAPAAESPVTRRELMQEFLGESAGAVL